MSKVYIAAAFRKFSVRENQIEKAYGEISDQQYFDRLENIEKVFLNYGISTCLPHRDEGMWGKIYYEPGPLSMLCLRHVATSDILFAIAESGRGVHIEMGYAAALENKNIILAYHENEEMSTLSWGLTNGFSPWDFNKNKNLHIFSYKNDEDLLEKTSSIIEQIGFSKKNINLKKKNIGLVDIGSHTLKFKIYSYSPSGYTNNIHSSKNSIAIINDIIENQEFSTKTINSVCEILQNWSNECDSNDCESLYITGTEALRKSKNTIDLLNAIKDKIGKNVEIINNEKELDFVYYAVKKSFFDGAEIGVLNLGGGSVQIGIGNDNIANNKYYLDFGTNILNQKYPWISPISKKTFDEMVAFVTEKIFDNYRDSIKKVENIVYTGGEIDFMLRCQLPLNISKLSYTHISEISVNNFKKFCYEFCDSTPENISNRFAIDIDWVKGSVSANAIALAVCKVFGIKNIIPSNMNISEGALHYFLNTNTK